MRRYLPLVAAVALLAAAGTISHVSRHSSSTADAAQLAAKRQLANLSVAPPIQHANLAIFPILSRTPRTDDLYVSLDEGLAAGTVEIYEVGSDGNRIVANAAVESVTPNQEATNVALETNAAVQAAPQGSAQVNRLMLVNRSGKPLYLMPGEVVVGGSQDRTIAQERVIASSDEPVSLDVFCVEHGRWGGRGREGNEAVIASLSRASLAAPANPGGHVDIGFPVADASVPQLAAKADMGGFVLSGSNLNKAARIAVQGEINQNAVWEKLAQTVEQTARFAPLMDVVVQTGSFSATSASTDVAAHLEPYLKTLQKPIADRENVVGVVVAVNGHVETFDLFESTPLFRKLWPKLLKSYALDAAGMAVVQNGSNATQCSTAEARQFLKKGMLANVAHSEVTPDGLEVNRCPTNGFIGFSVNRTDGRSQSEFGTMNYAYCAGAAPAIHACGFSCSTNPDRPTGNVPAAIFSGGNRGDSNRNPARIVTDAFSGE